MHTRCQTLGLARSSFCYCSCGESADNLELMHLLDAEFTQHNFKGVLGLRDHLRLAGHVVNRKCVRRLVRLMGHEPVYPKPRLRITGQDITLYPYLLRGRPITAPNEVWSTDITYVPMAKGFLYLVAVLNWHARYVLSWQLSKPLTWASACGPSTRPWASPRLRTSLTLIRAASSRAWPMSRPY